jgi:hypothetical protein
MREKQKAEIIRKNSESKGFFKTYMEFLNLPRTKFILETVIFKQIAYIDLVKLYI